MSKLQDEHIEFFFEISIDLMCIAGVDGYFKRVNPAFTKALGWTAEELLAKPFIEFVHPADRERTGNEVRRLASGIDTVCCFENRYRKKDGSSAWLGWTCPAATPENGLLYAVARDISEQKKIQEHLVQLATYDSLTGLANPDFSPRCEPRLKVSMVNIRTATPQINRFGTDAERGQSSEWEAVIVEKLRVLWSKV